MPPLAPCDCGESTRLHCMHCLEVDCAELQAENDVLWRAIRIMRAGWKRGEPSSMALVVKWVEELLAAEGIKDPEDSGGTCDQG